MNKDLLKIAITAALEAAKKILKIYNESDDFDVQFKSNDSPLTKADVFQTKLLSHI